MQLGHICMHVHCMCSTVLLHVTRNAAQDTRSAFHISEQLIEPCDLSRCELGYECTLVMHRLSDQLSVSGR